MSMPTPSAPNAKSERLRERKFAFSALDHRAIAKPIYEAVGIMLSVSKAQLIRGRLAPRVRVRSLASINEYVARITGDPDKRGVAVDGLTAKHTSCFGRSLAERLDKDERVRLPSGRCATAGEPYSWPITIFGADYASALHTLACDLRQQLPRRRITARLVAECRA